MNKWTLLLSMAALGIAHSSVLAQDDAKPEPRASRLEIIKKYDTNGDGKLDDAERQAAREDIQKLGETAPGTEARPAAQVPPGAGRLSREEMIKKYDQNGDGKLDETERNVRREEIMKTRAKAAEDRSTAESTPGRSREAVIKEFDKDGDGKLSDTERQVAMVEMRKRYQAQVMSGRTGDSNGRPAPDPAGSLKKYDQDGDGKISDTERAAMREDLKKNMEKRRPRPGQKPGAPAPAPEAKKN